MKLSPRTFRMAPGSMSPRSGASRLPRRSFQEANNLLVDALFMGQPCLILLRPAPSAVLVRDRGAVARVFSAVLEVSEHAPCRAPPRARSWRGRRGLALIGARVGRWPGRIVNGEWRVTRRDQGSGI